MRLRRRRKSREIKPFSVERATSSAPNNHGSYFNQQEWLEELDETVPGKKVEEQAPTSACRTKLLASGPKNTKIQNTIQPNFRGSKTTGIRHSARASHNLWTTNKKTLKKLH